jgi:UDP-N-acetyl-D-mannosaminuronic acid dehydrogenase
MPHIPGAGVGGMCIPINPYYLLHCAREAGTDLPLVRQARKINENMPHHMVELVGKALYRIKTPIERARICVLGLAYKADVDDYRGAPGEKIAIELGWMGANIICYDPLVIPANKAIKFTDSPEEAIKGVDCIVITTDHSAFRSLDLKSIAKLANNPLAIVDGRHVLKPKEVEDLGITYIGIGRNRDSRLNIWDFRSKLRERRE